MLSAGIRGGMINGSISVALNTLARPWGQYGLSQAGRDFATSFLSGFTTGAFASGVSRMFAINPGDPGYRAVAAFQGGVTAAVGVLSGSLFDSFVSGQGLDEYGSFLLTSEGQAGMGIALAAGAFLGVAGAKVSEDGASGLFLDVALELAGTVGVAAGTGVWGYAEDAYTFFSSHADRLNE